MAEYIEREAVKRLVNNNFSGLLAAIDFIPAADVTPVVRCKDCKHYGNNPNGLCFLHTEPKASERGYSGEAVCVEPDDFCSYGTPKNDGGET